MTMAKRILSIVLTVLMLFSMSAVAVSAYTVPDGFAVADTPGKDETGINGEVYGLIGDVETDDTVNIKDATLIQKVVAELEELDKFQTVVADVDFDGNVNIKDATAIQKWVAGIAVEELINYLIYIPAEETQPTTTEEPEVTTTEEPEVTTTEAPEVTTTETPEVTTTEAPEVTTTEAPEVTTTEAPEVTTTEAPEVTTTEAPEITTTEEPEATTITVYFTNNEGWDTVNVHAWTDNGDVTTWPGVAMTYYRTNSYGQDIYSYELPADTAGVVFNAGQDAEQTVSIKTANGLFMGDGYGYYCTEKDSEGKWAVESFEVEAPVETTAADTTVADGTTSADDTTAADTTADTVETTAAPVLVASDYAIRGTFTDWGSNDALYYVAGSNTVIEATYELAAGEYKFKVYGLTSGVWYGNDGTIEGTCDNWGFRDGRADCTLVITTAGKYTFTIDVTDSTRLGVSIAEAVETPETTAAPETTVAETTVAETTVAETTVAETTVAETTVAEDTTVAESNTITVYFTNNWAFETQNAYWWGSTTGENSAQWPGTQMTYVRDNSNGQGIYSIEIPADVEGLIFSGISDVDHTTLRQTVDIKEGIVDNAGFYCDSEVDGKITVGTYTYSDPVETTVAETTAAETTVAETTVAETTVAETTVAETTVAETTVAETTVAETTVAETTVAEDTTVAESNTITVYFTNNWAFETQNAYWWGSTTGENSAQWPGTQMTYVRDNSNGQGIYSIEIPADVEGLIFSGISDVDHTTLRQTVDIKEGIVDNAGFYCDSEVDGKITVGTYTYDDPAETTVAEDTTVVEDTTVQATDAPETTVAETTVAETTVAETTVAETTVAETTVAETTVAETTVAETTVAETTVAETTVPEETEPEAIKVYAINSAKWDAVCAYYWGGVTAPSWPGYAMTKTGEQVNGFDVYEYTFETAPQNIIFNNNNKGSQTADLTFMEGKYYDVKSKTWYDSLEDVPAVSATASDRYLAGSFNGWSTTANEFMLAAEGDDVAYLSIELEANTTYEFKVVREGTWTSCKDTLSITDTVTGLTFSSSVSGNTKITTKDAGVYVFAFGMSDSKLSVTYP